MDNSSCHDDVIWEIFLKLPVKSLVRFKTLSTKWNSVISDPGFIRSQLHEKSESHKKFIIYNKSRCRTLATFEIKDNHFDGGKGYAIQTNQIEIPKITNPNSRFLFHNIGSLMHCDGLLCLFSSRYQNQDAKVVVWNPSTMQQRNFYRPMPNRFYCVSWEAFGFVYDSTIDDYKVVYVRGHPGLGLPGTKVRTLRLKLGSWEAARTDVPFLFNITETDPTAVHFNGCLYWIGQPIQNNGSKVFGANPVVICFDLAKGRMIEETSLSAHDPPVNSSCKFGFLKGSFCLAGCYYSFRSIDISVLKEDEITKTKVWVKLMRIPSAINVTGLCCFHLKVNLIDLTKDGQVLTYEHNRDIDLFLCDSKNQTLRTIQLLNVSRFKQWPISVIPYVQSLIPP